MKITFLLLISFVAFALFSNCNKEKIENEQILLENFLAENNIADSLAESSGLFCLKTGFSTPATLISGFPKKGDSVITVYKGYLLSDSKVIFDETSFEDPGRYVYLEDPVISGWEEAMGLLKKDMSALLIIPSDLAYKGKQIGVIPPYSTLIFEVRIIDIK